MLLICLLLAAAAVLTACGEKPESAQPPVQEVSPVADEQPAQEPEPAPEVQTPAEAEEPAEPEAEEPALTEDAETPSVLETALSFVDQDAQLLLDALGEPQQKLYEASCSGPGDDGIWIYDDVTVFTYLETALRRSLTRNEDGRYEKTICLLLTALLLCALLGSCGKKQFPRLI